MGLLDRYYEKDLSVDAAKELLKKCLRELKVRFIVNFPKFTVKLIDKDGVRVIDLDWLICSCVDMCVCVWEK